MKNKVVFILLILILLIVGIIVASEVIKNSQKTNEIINNIDNTKKDDKVAIINGWVINQEENQNIIETSFKGYLKQEWQDMITKFYNEYNKKNIKNVECKFNNDNKYIGEVYDDNNKQIALYIFDDNTGYATDENTGITIDFVNRKIVEQLNKNAMIFDDNLNCLAVGFLNSDTESRFINKYFKNEASYNSIIKYDFRDESEKINIPDYKMIFIPRTDDTEISIYRCNVNDEGKIVKGETLINKETQIFSLALTNDEIIIPKYIVKVKLTDLEREFEIAFSGENGKLVLTEDVMDISIY